MITKVQSRAKLVRIVKDLKRSGKRIVFTNGCFDLLHVGHIRYLAAAKQEGDVLVLGLNSDRSVRELKGEDRPLVPEAERAEVLSALEMIDFVCIFDEPTPRELIQAVEPDVLVKGGDWKQEEVVGKEEVEGSGGKVVVVPEIEGKSTRTLIAEIARKYHSQIEI